MHYQSVGEGQALLVRPLGTNVLKGPPEESLAGTSFCILISVSTSLCFSASFAAGKNFLRLPVCHFEMECTLKGKNLHFTLIVFLTSVET